ncbi:MAG: hypothetical protein Q8P72_01935 [Candidatus Roizmanbacteria bacterium]|nr:hypothetical protein [Candidatus Roizmanbacteria bacterium]
MPRGGFSHLSASLLYFDTQLQNRKEKNYPEIFVNFMAVEQGNNFLSQSWQMKDAFEHAHRMYESWNIRDLSKASKKNMLKVTTCNYVLAGFSWFANRSNDQHLEEIGTTAWWLTRQYVVRFSPVSDVRVAAVQDGLDPRIASRCDPRSPLRMAIVNNDSPGIELFGIKVFLPFSLCEQAQGEPIGILASIANLASQLHDFGTGRYLSDNVNLRGRATHAHVLGKASRLYPDIALTAAQEEMIQEFPFGIHSLTPHSENPVFNGNQIPNYWKN